MSEVEDVCGRTKVVPTKKGKVVVRELMIEDLMGVTSAFMQVFSALSPEDFKSGNEILILVKIGKSKALLDALKILLCSVTDQKEGFYDRFPLVDLAKVIVAFFEVNELEEVKKAFFAVTRMFPTLLKKPSSNLSAEVSSVSSASVPATA